MGRRLRPDETDFPWDAAGSSPGLNSTWQRLPISGIEGLSDAVLGAGLDAVQMSRGRMAGSLVFSEADGILYGSGSIDGRVSLVGSLSEERITVGIGLAFPGGARHWHRDVPTGGVGIFLAGDEHDARYAPGACYATATMTEERLEQEAAGRDLVLDRHALGGTRIHTRPAPDAVVQALHRRVMAVHAGSDGDPSLGPDLLSAIVAHCAREPRASAGTGRRPDHGLIVRRARAYIAEHLDEPISLDAIAAAARTSRRTLTRAFCALVEESPTLYARRLRLHRIRHDLVSPEEALTSIAIIAAKWGVGEPGRVSGWYRELFDELPSETRAAYRQRSTAEPDFGPIRIERSTGCGRLGESGRDAARRAVPPGRRPP